MAGGRKRERWGSERERWGSEIITGGERGPEERVGENETEMKEKKEGLMQREGEKKEKGQMWGEREGR